MHIYIENVLLSSAKFLPNKYWMQVEHLTEKWKVVKPTQ